MENDLDEWRCWGFREHMVKKHTVRLKILLAVHRMRVYRYVYVRAHMDTRRGKGFPPYGSADL